MVTKVKELNNIRPGLGAADLALALQDNETRESKIDKRLKFGGLKGSTKKSIKLLSHFLRVLFDQCPLKGAKENRVLIN